MDEELRTVQGAPQQPSGGNFFSRLGWLFLSPSKLYADVDRAPLWWQPWIWVTIIGFLGVYVGTPVNRAVTALNPGGMNPEQLQKTLEMMDKYSYLGYITVPFATLVQALIISAIGYVVLSIIVTDNTFKKYFTLYLYSNVIVSVGAVLAMLLVRQKGIDSIQSARDATVSFGLNFLVPEGHKFIEAVAGSFNVFSIWSYIIIAMGVMRLFRATVNQAVLAVLPIWFINMLFGLGIAAVMKTG
jgi:hypothetical protein